MLGCSCKHTFCTHSGPLRFDMDVASRKWVNHRDNTDELCKKLEDELLELTGAAVFLQQQ